MCDRERKRGEGGRGENVGLITSLCKVCDGGEGRGQWRTVKSSRVGGSSANERADSIVPDQW